MFWGKRGFRRLKNKNLKKLIVKPENVSSLEDLLAVECKRVDHMNKLKDSDSLDFGPYLTSKEIDSLLLDIKKDVDSFLDAGVINYPKCYYFEEVPWNKPFDHYLRVREEIVLVRKKRASIVSSLAHEYTHHVQSCKGLPSFHYSIIKEGHARGVERYVSKLFRDRENDYAFTFDSYSLSVDELKGCYSWVCDVNGVKPKKEFTKGLIRKVVSDHSIGSSLLFLYENVYGPAIYKTIAKKKVPECFFD